jgi:hypothetical protein
MIQVSKNTPDGDRLTNPHVEYPTAQVPQGDETIWWAAQMILGLPIPALLVYEIAVILLGAMPQTLVDGSSTKTGK